MNFLEDIYRLRYIKRYSNIPTIHDESVAEHGFFVAAIVMDLHDSYEFNLGTALAMAIAHDMPEIELNDCPHIIKNKYPEIKEAYKICESKVARTMPTSIQLSINQYNKGISREAKFVHLADIMQCIQYAEGEVKLGNAGYMARVINRSMERKHKLLKEIEKYER